MGANKSLRKRKNNQNHTDKKSYFSSSIFLHLTNPKYCIPVPNWIKHLRRKILSESFPFRLSDNVYKNPCLRTPLYDSAPWCTSVSRRPVSSVQVYPCVSVAALRSSPGCATWEIFQAGGRGLYSSWLQPVGCQALLRGNMLLGTSSKTSRFLRTTKPLFRFGKIS